MAGVQDTYEERDSDFLCPVCLDLMTEAYITTCGHSFCHGCIVKSFDLSNKCPKCNLPFENRQCIFPNTALNTILAKRKKASTVKMAGGGGGGVAREFAAIIQRNEHHLDANELNYMMDVLNKKRSELDAQKKTSEKRLLHEFLDQLKRKKSDQLQSVQDELNQLEKDLNAVKGSLETSKSSVDHGAVDDDDALAGDSAAFNASSSSVSSLSLSQQRVRMHYHFDDLERKYWSSRNSLVDGGADLRDFQHNLHQLTRYSQLRPLANLSYGSDLLNTANIVSSIEFDKDADFFAIAGVTKRIKVYDYEAVVRNVVVDMHYPVMEMTAGSKISCVSWSSYHKSLLCSSDYEGNVSVWDAAVGTRVRVFQEHEKRCWSVDFNRVDSHLVASGSDDSRVKLWSVNSEHSVATLEARANVCCVKFNPLSRYHLAYGAADHCVHYVDLRQPKEPLRIFKGHRKAVSYVKFINDKELVSASTDSQLKVWTTEDNTCVRSFQGHTNEKNFVGLSNDSDFIACGSENNALYVYCKALSQPLLHYKFDVVKSVLDASKERSSEQQQHNDAESAEFISAVCWKPESNVIVAANSQGTIKFLQLV